MAIGIFGKKFGMTHIFDEDGSSIPVTLVKADPCQISQIKTLQTDGYNAIQVAYGECDSDSISKPAAGHFRKSSSIGFKASGEFRVKDSSIYSLGEKITVGNFEIGQKVKITGKSIGKGFSGNQKRHNFSRGPMTHGSKNHRLPGSIGAGSTPGRVYPGKKMAGQLGNSNVTIKNSKIVYLNTEENLLVLSGSMPGKENNMLKIVIND
jgi:large subunit ribosomal protein L3